MGLVPSLKEKGQVNYRHRESCATCDHFYAPSSCGLVVGPVSRDMLCDLYEVKSQEPVYKDGEFFLREYEKTSNPEE
jgi:hypothetical protein